MGRLQQIGEKERGSARVGEERGAPIHRIEINGPNSLSHLSSQPQRKKMPKDLLFPEECLLKLQTPMPQNMKEKRKRSLTSFQKIGVSHKGISHHICLPRVIMNGQIIIFNQFEPPSSPQIQLLLSENVIETFMIDVNVTRLAIEIMPQRFYGKYHCGQFKIMSWIIPFMLPQLP
jgi:hypothetical protein